MKNYDIPTITARYRAWADVEESILTALERRIKSGVLPKSACELRHARFKEIVNDDAVFTDYADDTVSISLMALLNYTQAEWVEYVQRSDDAYDVEKKRVQDEKTAQYHASEIQSLKRLAAKYPDALA